MSKVNDNNIVDFVVLVVGGCRRCTGLASFFLLLEKK
jgi:hypothetical protein